MEKNTNKKKVSGDASWISPALVEDTIRVWSKLSRRVIGKVEAVEILINARRLMVLAQKIAGGDNSIDVQRAAA